MSDKEQLKGVGNSPQRKEGGIWFMAERTDRAVGEISESKEGIRKDSTDGWIGLSEWEGV